MVFTKIKDLHSLLPKHKRVLDTKSHRLPHFIYPVQQMQNIKVTHQKPQNLPDRLALFSVKIFRFVYDAVTRYNLQRMTQKRWINRVIFLETIAGVPGMVGGMCKHLKCLRSFEQDKGFIHHLLEEADNQRFHLFLFLHMRNPGYFIRFCIIFGQAIFMNGFFIAYLISQRFCHRFVGYLQQQAVKTYTAMLSQIDRKQSIIHKWTETKAPDKAIQYYHLSEDATMRDVILAIRADQSTHRVTNHVIADIDNTNFQLKQEDIYKEQQKQKFNQSKKQ